MTMISRILGFLRDVVIANMLGASALTDAFFVSFKLPNLLRRLFAEGAFNAGFVPMFSGMLKTSGKDAAIKFAAKAAAVLTTILILVTLLAISLMPYLVAVIAPGFEAGTVLFSLTVELSRITFPYIIFISLVCLLGGVLNSVGRFASVAAAPILMNIAIILSLLLLSPFTETGAHALAYGVLIAGILQFFWLVFSCMREGVLPKVAMPSLSPDIKKLLAVIAPAAIGAGVMQINILIDMILASRFDNAISFLYYADRLYELPLGVIGVAVATALLPALSKSIAAGNHEESRRMTDNALKLVMLLGIPSCFALLTISDPLIKVMFEHGEFDSSDRTKTSPAVVAYAIGIPAFLLIKIFATHFYAAKDTKTPVKVAALAVFINLVFNLVLMQYIEHVGLALSTSIAGWVNAIILGTILYKNGQYKPALGMTKYILTLIAAGIIMVLLLEVERILLGDYLSSSITLQIIVIATMVITGAATYFTAAILFGATSPKELKAALRK